MKQTFEEKVKSMTAKEIIMAMVKGLKRPKVEVDMDDYGYYRTEQDGTKVCCGCAATNTVCRIAEIKFTPETVSEVSRRAEAVKSDYDFFSDFEYAIDDLRRGWIKSYNLSADALGIAEITNHKNLELPELETNNYKENLHYYEALANAQESK